MEVLGVLILHIRLRGTTPSLRCIVQEFFVFWNAEFFGGGAIGFWGRKGGDRKFSLIYVPVEQRQGCDRLSAMTDSSERDNLLSALDESKT